MEIAKNKERVYFLTRLGQTETEEEKEAILREMSGREDTLMLLAEIEAKSAGVKDGNMEAEQGSISLSIGNSSSLKRLQEEAERESRLFSSIDGVKNSDLANRAKKRLNLDSLVFAKGNHAMTNSDFNPNSFRRERSKGYEEVYIPAPSSEDRKKHKIRRKPLKELPEWIQPIFKSKEFSSLNLI